MVTLGPKTEGIELVKAYAERVKGKTFLITGTTPGGLGAETALALAHGEPQTLILVARNEAKSQPTIDAIRAVDPAITVKFFAADLESLASVRGAAAAILADGDIPAIHAIINNAAVMATPFHRTVDGFERQMATNHLSSFLLTNLLVPRLLAAGAGARIVNVASVGSKYAGIQWGDPNFETPDSYTPWTGYGQSKTANILAAIAFDRRLAAKGIRAFAVNPGSIATNLQVYMTPEMAEEATQKIFGVSLSEIHGDILKTLPQGCAGHLEAALDPALDKAEGVYMNDCVLTADPHWVAPYALDKADAERLWKLTEEMIGEKFEY